MGIHLLVLTRAYGDTGPVNMEHRKVVSYRLIASWADRQDGDMHGTIVAGSVVPFPMALCIRYAVSGTALG